MYPHSQVGPCTALRGWVGSAWTVEGPHVTTHACGLAQALSELPVRHAYALLSSLNPRHSNASPLQPGVVVTAGNLSEQAVPLGLPFPCSSPLSLRWLLPAAWQLEVAGRDAVGNAAPPLRISWTVALGSEAGLVTRFTKCVGQWSVGMMGWAKLNGLDC